MGKVRCVCQVGIFSSYSVRTIMLWNDPLEIKRGMSDVSSVVKPIAGMIRDPVRDHSTPANPRVPPTPSILRVTAQICRSSMQLGSVVHLELIPRVSTEDRSPRTTFVHRDAALLKYER